MNDWKQQPQQTAAQESARVVHERKPLPDNEFSAVLSTFVRARVRTKNHEMAAWPEHKTLQMKNLRQTKLPRWPCLVQHRCRTKPLWEGEVSSGRWAVSSGR
jgi:hypothetical protein